MGIHKHCGIALCCLSLLLLSALPCSGEGAAAATTAGRGIGNQWARAAQEVLNTGNSSLIAAAATAAGAQLVKKAWEGSQLKASMEGAWQRGREREAKFNAVFQEKMGGMLSQGEGFGGDKDGVLQWMPGEWEQMKSTFTLPREWTAVTEMWREVQENVDGVKASVRVGLEDAKQSLKRMKRSASFDLKLRVPDWNTRTGSPGGPLSMPWDALLGEGGVIDRLTQHGSGASSKVRERFLSRLEHVKGHVAKQMGKEGGEGTGSLKISKMQEQAVQTHNNELIGRLFNVMGGDDWEHVLCLGGVNVYRKRITDVPGGEKFYCIKAVRTINARPIDVYDLLKDPQRVSEYNDECALTEELPPLSDDTRLTWACSKKYGPFKARDFITRVHHRKMTDGTLVVMSQSEDIEWERSQPGTDYVRTEVLLAGNVMRPDPTDPTKTEFTTIAHVNPGGAADTPLGSRLVNHICTHGPVNFINKLEIAAGPKHGSEPYVPL
eukprot:CAMPEP_0172039722 /NCGR_PEP_ID=MMETSP1041-20130122/24065_1 /TAXON_ID=464988 /ORGANISM="Hemiselmis andersenii, Strain CCMP439" /LENGTH=492 /DNA_ID=CAMNT_0012697469 /DNA_START=170 /DNA_END=1651 /DNA_ORIENTATION=-